tara:strand:- start:1666 stop:1920 length:255 start_codon:yes stop_codon:yes gene_type:complete
VAGRFFERDDAFELKKSNFLRVIGEGIYAKSEGASSKEVANLMRDKLRLRGRVNFSDRFYMDLIKKGEMGEIPQDYMLTLGYRL